MCVCVCLCFGDVSEARKPRLFQSLPDGKQGKDLDADELPPLLLFNCLSHVLSLSLSSLRVCLLSPAHFFQTSGLPERLCSTHERSQPEESRNGATWAFKCDRIFTIGENKESGCLLKSFCVAFLLNGAIFISLMFCLIW